MAEPMNEQQTRAIPFRSLLYMLLCGGVIVFFLAIAIIPNLLAIRELRREQQETSARITRQSILFPFYQKTLAMALEKENRALPFPAAATLARDRIDEARSDFAEAALRTNMDLELVPEFASLSGGSRMLTANVSARGDFHDFRRLLVELGDIPYLTRMGEIRIQALPGGNRYEIKCGLALEEQR